MEILVGLVYYSRFEFLGFGHWCLNLGFTFRIVGCLEGCFGLMVPFWGVF